MCMKRRKKKNTRKYQLEYYYRNRDMVLKKARLNRLLKRLGNKIANIESIKERYDETYEQIQSLKEGD